MKIILHNTVLLLTSLLLFVPALLNAQAGYLTTYAVGDQAQGGTVIQVDETGTIGLVAANQDQCGSCEYWVNVSSEVNDPAKHDAAGQVYSDWRVPNINELTALYDQRALFNNFSNDDYWTSTTSPNDYARIKDMQTGEEEAQHKSFWNSFRAVRSFDFSDENNNTFSGYQAGNANTVNTTGHSNTFTGYRAGYSNTSGKYNTFIGYQTGHAGTTGSKNIYIGYGAGENNSGNDNVCLGYKAGQNNEAGTRNVFLGFAAGINETGSNKLYIANSNTTTPLIYGDFNAGALTVNGSLTVTGDAFKAGGGSWSVASDRRLKKDIEAFTDGLEVLQKINPVRFRYNGKAGMPADKEYVGVIAQEMQKIAPYTVATFTHKDTDGIETDYLEYDASALDYIIINAVKAQQKIIASQQKEIESLKSAVYGLVNAAEKASEADKPHTGATGEEE